jgi:DNA modification methylase
MEVNQIVCHDVMQPWPLPDKSVHCIVTSPPYWNLRDYGVAGQIGLEATPAEYIEKMVKKGAKKN